MKTIVMKFCGPLQSWGTGSNFETRHTDFYPSKSAVIGLISASNGYRRDDISNLNKLNKLDFAVRVDQNGNLMRDYHIARKNKKNGDFERTYVTNRYYLEDAVFTVAISHSDEKFIDEILLALKKPYFQTYMGRRALPLPYDFILDVTDKSAVDSLKSLEWQASAWYKKKHKKDQSIGLELYADGDLLEDVDGVLRKDRAISFSQKDRRFGFRYESRVWVYVENEEFISDDSQHDIFDRV